METVADRLKWAREQAGYESAADAARAMQIEVGTYRHHENATRGVKPPSIIRYAKFYGIDATWLMTGRGQPKKGESLSPAGVPISWAPVISWVEAGAMNYVHINSDEAEDRVPIAYHRDTVFALRVHGSSMNRVAPDGSVIVVDYEARVPVDGKLYVVRYGGDATFKRYRNTGGPERLVPDSTEPHEIIFPVDGFEVIGRVVFIMTVA